MPFRCWLGLIEKFVAVIPRRIPRVLASWCEARWESVGALKICQRYVFNVDLGDCGTIASIMFSVVPFQIDCHASIWTGSQCQAFLADGSLLVLVLLSSYIGLCKGSPGCTAPLELCSGAGERAMCARLRQTVWWGGVCSCRTA